MRKLTITSLFTQVLFIFAIIPFLFCVSGCAFVRVKRSKNIVYLKASAPGHGAQQLSVFAPRRHGHPDNVLVFIHGGNWTSGRKSLYSFLGNRMARKQVVTVIIDYPPSPTARYDEMAADAAAAIKWVHENIAQYGGDPDKIFVSDHSAGGQLAALISTDDKYFNDLHIKSPIKGTILIDAAGLNMYGYMKDIDYGPHNSYLKVFTSDPAVWKEASPLYHLHPDIPPMLIYQGGKTYPSIASGNKKFVAALRVYQPDVPYHIIKGRRHIPMITQFFNTHNPAYKEMIRFMDEK